MANSKKKILKKYEKAIVKQEKFSQSEFEEMEHKLQEQSWESSEGLGIEKQEEKGEEAYPEIEKAIKKEADEEEEED